MSLREYLVELGASEDLVNTIDSHQFEVKGYNKTPEELTQLQSKYERLGFVTQTRQIKFKLSNLLWIKLELEYNYRLHLDHPTLHMELEKVYEDRKKLLGGIKKEHIGSKYLALVPPQHYYEEVPEHILDTMLKHQKAFEQFYIGTVVFREPILDPILFGSNQLTPVYGSFWGSHVYWMAVLGIWGSDWYELNLNKKSWTSERTTTEDA